ncbi:hypothetical protein [Aquiflexum sp.]
MTFIRFGQSYGHKKVKDKMSNLYTIKDDYEDNISTTSAKV